MRAGWAGHGEREAQTWRGENRDAGKGSKEIAAVRDRWSAPRGKPRSDARVTNWGTGNAGRRRDSEKSRVRGSQCSGDAGWFAFAS